MKIENNYTVFININGSHAYKGFTIVNNLVNIDKFTFSKIVDNNFNHILAFDNSINHPENFIGSI